MRADTAANRRLRIIGTLRGGLNGTYKLTAATVTDDGAAVDSMTGGAGTDWFWTFGDTVNDGGELGNNAS